MLRKLTLVPMLLLLLSVATKAQKLPNVQKNSVYVAADTKINGKGGEWAAKFEAYNRATEIYYTMANDDSNLYLVVKATDPLIIKKILYGSITFTIGALTKDKKGLGLKITYPSLTRPDRNELVAIRSQISINSKNGGGSKANDSLLNVLNTKLTNNSAIKVTGSPSLPDSTVLTGKNSDIKVLPAFGKDYAYTCKLLIPIKYLKTAGVNEEYFDYNIKLNGIFYNTNTSVQLSADGQYSLRSTPGYGSVEVANTSETSILDFATDFLGKYILAKKP